MAAGASERDQLLAEGSAIAARVRASNATIYDHIDPASDRYFPTPTLEVWLDHQLRGLNLDYAIRTRSKVAKTAVAEALGYVAPKSFKKTAPRFLGQNLDIATQVASNFQIWNTEVDPMQRYGFIIPHGHVAERVFVLSGETVARFDNTGTLTSKYQAARRSERTDSALVSDEDTSRFQQLLGPLSVPSSAALASVGTATPPIQGLTLPIAEVHHRLLALRGKVVPDPGATQDRRRGELLQVLAAEALGLGEYTNRGQWPDLLSQALELKLQMSPTVDLGLVLPSSADAAPDTRGLRHCDVRYALAFGSAIDSENVRIDEVVVTTGEDFFDEFRQFGGLGVNSKLQLRLPPEWFEFEGSEDRLL